MSLIDKLPKLAELVKEIPPKGIENVYDTYYEKGTAHDIWIDRDDIANLLSASPVMLAVLVKFQPGYTRLIELAVETFDQWSDDESRRIRACLLDLQEACRLMEAP